MPLHAVVLLLNIVKQICHPPLGFGIGMLRIHTHIRKK